MAETSNITFELADKRIVVTGGHGKLGTSVVERLLERGVPEANIVRPRSRDFDLTTPFGCASLYRQAFPRHGVDLVLHCAAAVGGIGANLAMPGKFFYDNMAMNLHMIEEGRKHGLVSRGGKFVAVGSMCAYPKNSPMPIHEEVMWDGYPEPSNGPYGVAKRAAGTMLDAYNRQYGLRCAWVLPINLYGPGDDYHPEHSHVIGALIRKFVNAVDAGESTVTCWGSGAPTREFLYVDDCAEGVVRAAERLDEPIPVNLGTGQEVAIRELAETIAELVGFKGELEWDTSRPDGQPRRSLDSRRARQLLGFEATVSLKDGLKTAIADYHAYKAAHETQQPAMAGA